MLKFKYLLALLFVWSVTLTAQIPAGYYDRAEGKKEAELKTALFYTIRNHTQIEYYSSATHFRTTDWHPEGYFWDMYSNNRRSTWNGSVINREHSMPKSWFGIGSGQENSAPIGSDLHNLFPSDAEANTAKSNFPLGETPGQEFNNGVSKVGNNTFPGYVGTVFEPADQYKGDFARTFMYMVTRYENYEREWRSLGTASMLFQNTYPTLRPYAVNLLLKWHRNDPVSEKEVNRNNAVYVLQGNRNPFIDHPVLAEYIWGSQKGNAWDSSTSADNVPEYFFIQFRHRTKDVVAKLTPVADVGYRIVNMSGQTIKTGNLTTGLTTVIPVSELPGGTYLFMVETARNRHVRLFVVH